MKNKQLMGEIQLKNGGRELVLNKNSTEFCQLVYEFMNGYLALEVFPVEESRYIENEFEKGKYCDKKYQEIYEANIRLCERLGNVNEDDEAELIINSLLDIQKHLCTQMFKYGWMFAMCEKMQ